MKTYLGLRVFESGTRCSLTSAYVSGSLKRPQSGLELGRICCQLTYIELESSWGTSFICCWPHSNLFLHHGSESSDCVRETQKLKTNPRVVSEVSECNGRHRLYPVSWLCLLQDDVGFPDALPSKHPCVRSQLQLNFLCSVLLSVLSARWWGNLHRCESGQTAGWPAKASAPKQQVDHSQCVQSIQVVHTLDKEEKALCTLRILPNL